MPDSDGGIAVVASYPERVRLASDQTRADRSIDHNRPMDRGSGTSPGVVQTRLALRATSASAACTSPCSKGIRRRSRANLLRSSCTCRSSSCLIEARICSAKGLMRAAVCLGDRSQFHRFRQYRARTSRRVRRRRVPNSFASSSLAVSRGSEALRSSNFLNLSSRSASRRSFFRRWSS